MNFASLIFDCLERAGVTHCFAVPGGGNMFLIDAAHEHPSISLKFCHHEQSAAIAAEAYYKASGRIACCIVTSGPGATNSLTGIVGAWLDSSPMVVLSGQVKTSDLSGGILRQKGPQEVDFIPMVKGVTLFSAQLLDNSLSPILDGLNRLRDGKRSGPIVFSVPLDVQNSRVERYPDLDTILSTGDVVGDNLGDEFGSVFEKLRVARRPLILIGEGCRRVPRETMSEFFKRCNALNIFCVFSWLSYDLLPWDDRINMGRPGGVAKRHSNITVQCADCLLVVGSRLDPTQTAFNPDEFGKNADVSVIDVDRAELDKLPERFQKIEADSRNFISVFNKVMGGHSATDCQRDDWVDFCDAVKSRFGQESANKVDDSDWLSIESVVDHLSNWAPENAIIVTGSSGLSVEIFHSGFRNKHDQRIFLTTALGSMGYGLPALVGAKAAVGDERVTILFESDGSFMMNIQELASIDKGSSNTVIFLINNNGYASIRSSQSRHFGKVMGTDPSSGLDFPDFPAVVKAFGIDCVTCDSFEMLGETLLAWETSRGLLLIELMVEPQSQLLPKCGVVFSEGEIVTAPLEDMDPKLERADLEMLMAITEHG